MSAAIQIINPGTKDGDVLRADVTGTNISKSAYDIDTGLLSLTGKDTIANYQKVLRTITYDNIHKEPDPKDRYIQFAVTDVDGAQSVARQTTLKLLNAPDVIFYLPLIAPLYRLGEEPNDTCATALGISNNVEFFFKADKAADHDWFYFDLFTPSDVTVELNNFAMGQIILHATSGGCGNLAILENNGSNEPDKLVELDVIPAGRYYIRIIYDGGITAAPTYRLVVHATPMP
jgi:hypothetical protein